MPRRFPLRFSWKSYRDFVKLREDLGATKNSQVLTISYQLIEFMIEEMEPRYRLAFLRGTEKQVIVIIKASQWNAPPKNLKSRKAHSFIGRVKQLLSELIDKLLPKKQVVFDFPDSVWTQLLKISDALESVGTPESKIIRVTKIGIRLLNYIVVEKGVLTTDTVEIRDKQKVISRFEASLLLTVPLSSE